MGKSGQQRQADNITRALDLIWRFGLIRRIDLARAMWPRQNEKSRKSSVRDFVAMLEQRTLVLIRQLPEGAGDALVLAEAGARHLAQRLNITCHSGKDIGETHTTPEGFVWTPPSNWPHKLKADGLLCILIAQGWKIVTECELRRAHPRAEKLPDGLAFKTNAEGETTCCLWIEVENKKKEGADMQGLIQALLRVDAGQAQTLCGYQATHPMIAYDPATKDSRGYNLNHRKRVVGRLNECAPNDFDLLLAPLLMKGLGVDAVEMVEAPGRRPHFLVETVRAARVDQAIGTLEWGARFAGGECGGNDDWYAEVWPKDSAVLWRLEEVIVDSEGLRSYVLIADGTAPTIEEAKRAIGVHLVPPDE